MLTKELQETNNNQGVVENFCAKKFVRLLPWQIKTGQHPCFAKSGYLHCSCLSICLKCIIYIYTIILYTYIISFVVIVCNRGGCKYSLTLTATVNNRISQANHFNAKDILYFRMYSSRGPTLNM